MGKRLPHTPTSQIRSAIRKLWLRSRERACALKREKYCCERCGIKQSKRKGKEVSVQVHHKNGIDWQEVIDYIRNNVLCKPEDLEIVCDNCHKEHHKVKNS